MQSPHGAYSVQPSPYLLWKIPRYGAYCPHVPKERHSGKYPPACRCRQNGAAGNPPQAVPP